MGHTSAFRTEFAPFECSRCIQVKPGQFSVAMQYQGLPGTDRAPGTPAWHFCRLRRVVGLWGEMHLRAGAVCWKDVLWKDVFAGRMFWVSIETAGAGLRMLENPQLFLWDLLEASEKRACGQDSLMRDSELLCPGPVKLLLNSGEFYQLIQWEWSQRWMLLYLWLCLRRDRSSFTFTSLYYNKAPDKGT